MSASPRPDATRLIESYRSYAHAIAAEVLKKLPPWVAKDDVVGAAELGLVEAAQSYDPNRGVLFKTFAYYRIRGAVYDDLRKNGWLKQVPALRFEAASNEYFTDYTSAGSSAPASAAEQREQLEAVTATVLGAYFLSLSDFATEPPDHARSAEEGMLDREAQARVRAALARLPEKNRQVIEEYYFRDRNLDQIGKMLGLSKSWVCRLHARSLELLRGILEEQPAAKATAP